MKTLAILGGDPVLNSAPAPYRTIGIEESRAVQKVMDDGELSSFLGSWNDAFYGGPNVRAFESEWAEHFKVTHAVSVNSATSGLIAALGAVGVEPGDEVIVSPWTMCASATAVLVWGAVPVFADIEEETFNLDVASIKRNLSPQTRAIVLPDIFGHAAALEEIMEIAASEDLLVIEDASQAPGALYRGAYVGTLAHIGVFSLNYHKHIHTGEGGVCVTNDSKLAERMQLIRNHGEAVVEGKGVDDISNIIGFNFRMPEIEAAIGREQLKKLDTLLARRQEICERLSRGLSGLSGLQVPRVWEDCTHAYYLYGMILDPEVVGVPKNRLIDALEAEGIAGLTRGYANLHLLPMYQRRIAMGKKGYPWNDAVYSGEVSYQKGICPVAERLQDETYVGLLVCLYDYSNDEVDKTIEAFQKVWEQRELLL